MSAAAATPLRRILVANRGEIACRIIRSIHALGASAVAVYSEADAGARHVALADMAMPIGPAPARDSYLSIARLIEAAGASGADSVHPGYGFLSENADFAEACRAAGLVFIGPTPEAIRAMGNKANAKRLLAKAGVPCVPGYQEAEQSDARLEGEAARIGFPIMVKAAAGGGGRGMRWVAAAAELGPALAAARAEALAAFASDELILEKALADARHIEIQIFADRQGNIVHLGERDCSIQRRHQKVIEEAPAPALAPGLREAMGAAAIAAARAIGYVGAGTVEFLLDSRGDFFFLEMNTRLQVEHPVTEAITGLDLVAWQIRIAGGEPLPLRQKDIAFSGHAIEARLYAEDVAGGFLPQTGKLLAWSPPEGAGIRVDHGLAESQAITPYYDSMLAKVIAFGKDREDARRRLVAALETTIILGVQTDRAFLIACLLDPDFIAGRATTAFLSRPTPIVARPARPDAVALALAAAIMLRAAPPPCPAFLAGWRPTGPFATPFRLACGDAIIDIEVSLDPTGGHMAEIGGERIAIAIRADGGRRLRFASAKGATDAAYVFAEREGRLVLHLACGAEDFAIEDATYLPRAAAEPAAANDLRAPMNGAIVAVNVKPGDRVAKGQSLIVLEAMKMRHEIRAPAEGRVVAVAVKLGDQAAARKILVELAYDGAAP